MANIFEPSVNKREFTKRAPMSSEDINAFQDEVVADMSRLARVLNTLNARYDLKVLELEGERRKLLAYAEGVRSQKRRDDHRRAVLGQDISYFQNFRDLEGMLHTGISLARRLRVEPAFGQAMLPFNNVVSRFVTKNPDTDELFLPSTVDITITPVDEGSGSLAGDIKAGTPRLCVDGMSAEPWIRKVLFPLESDQEGVTMDVFVTVPTLFAADANLLTLIPSPAGEVDVLDIQYSTTSAAPSLVLPGFTATENVSAMRIHFAPLAITKLKIRLRQRHFVIEEGEKTFLYGLKELGLDLVELDRTINQATITDNNLVMFKVDAPSGYKFNQLKSFVSNPTFATAANDTEIYYKIFADAALTQELYSTYDDATPTSASPRNIGTYNSTSIYVTLRLSYDSGNSVSPVVNDFYMDFSTTAV